MNPLNNLDAFYQGSVQAAFSVFLFGGYYTEQQIDIVKEAVSRYRESEIEQSALPLSDKEELKQEWKTWLDTFTQGFKEELKRQGRLV